MAKWKTLRETVLMSHRPWFEVIQQEVETDRGVIVPDFYQVRFGAFVVCVPFTASGEVLTLRTYKHGLGRVSTTFPAGYIVSIRRGPRLGGLSEFWGVPVPR